MNTTSPQHTGCCDPFDPTPWQDREITWVNEPFVVDRILAFFHIPLTMGKRITENMTKIEAARMKAPVQLMLCDEDSLWGFDIYIHVTGVVPEAKMTALSGTFWTMVFEGPYNNVGKWMEEARAAAAKRGTPALKLYTSYTTCPRCAKAYGKNYVVIFAKIA